VTAETTTGRADGRGRGPRPKRRVEIDTEVMRRAREERGLSFRDLERLIGGVTSARLGQIEAGRGHPSPELAPQLAHALGLTLDELKGAK